MSALSPTTPEGMLGKGAYPPTIAVVRHVIDFLKWRFSKLPQGSYRWDPDSGDATDQTGSDVFISADTPIRPTVVGQRPAITVSRSQAAFQGTGLGDLAYVDLRTGAKVRQDLIPTNLMINVLSTVPIEAERLAWFVMEQIWTFREEIVKTMPELLYLGTKPMLSAASPAGSLVENSPDYEWVAVVVSFPCFLQHGATMLPLNKKILNGININATTPTPSQSVVPAVQLQGTAVLQASQSEAERKAATSRDLPQEGPDEAQSTEPLTVTIQTR
jgi:hypothetical protein